MLQVTNINAYYDDLQALWNLSLKIDSGEIVTICGSNGAGKTTLLGAIMGLVDVRSGRIDFQGERTDQLATHRIVAKGISLIPEGRRLFPYLTVQDNLEFGAYTCKDQNRKESLMKDCFDLFPVLAERRKQLAVTLSGGEQQMLTMGRGLMSNPKLLLLDEPTTGLGPLVKDMVFEAIRKTNKKGVAILLSEQDVGRALELADRAYVLESGRVTLAGSGKELLNNPHVKKAYLAI